VWVYGAQSYRPFGTAAQFTVVPAALAVDLPDDVRDEVGASLGIPGITAHRAVFGDGPVTGETVLVHGVLGGVGSLAAQLARWGGATVIGTVRHSDDLAHASGVGRLHAVALDQPDPAAAIRELAPDGVDKIIEVSFSDNVDLDAAVAKVGTVIAAYATRADRPDFPFWPMLFDNVTIRLLGSDDFPTPAKQQATADLTAAAREGVLAIPIGEPLPLEQAADAHDRVDAGSRQRVLLPSRTDRGEPGAPRPTAASLLPRRARTAHRGGGRRCRRPSGLTSTSIPTWHVRTGMGHHHSPTRSRDPLVKRVQLRST
jgi:NADPH:quinone reductase